MVLLRYPMQFIELAERDSTKEQGGTTDLRELSRLLDSGATISIDPLSTIPSEIYE